MSTPLSPSARDTAANGAEATRTFAEYERTRAAWQARHRAQEDARCRLAERYGNDQEKRWIANPNMPSVDAVSLIYAFLHKAGPASARSPEMEQAPELERDDALSAAHMIRVARDDARRRETALMRQIIAYGVTWDELACALDTTADEVRGWLRRNGEQLDTWTVAAESER